jgi:hypothetical protein
MVVPHHHATELMTKSDTDRIIVSLACIHEILIIMIGNIYSFAMSATGNRLIAGEMSIDTTR